MSTLECMILVPTGQRAHEINKTLPQGWKAFSYDYALAGLRAKVVLVPFPGLDHRHRWDAAREKAKLKVVLGGAVLDFF